ncbi:MAG: hypothetical protein U1F66_03870 [bacterium]
MKNVERNQKIVTLPSAGTAGSKKPSGQVHVQSKTGDRSKAPGRDPANATAKSGNRAQAESGSSAKGNLVGPEAKKAGEFSSSRNEIILKANSKSDALSPEDRIRMMKILQDITNQAIPSVTRFNPATRPGKNAGGSSERKDLPSNGGEVITNATGKKWMPAKTPRPKVKIIRTY